MDRLIIAAPPGRRIIVDSGALIAWSRGDERVRAIMLQADRLALPLVVPIVVIAQVIRGGPSDALINRFLKQAKELSPVTPTLARQAGILLGRTGTTDVIDAFVVAEALHSAPSMIITSDPGDIRSLLQSDLGHPRVQIVAI